MNTKLRITESNGGGKAGAGHNRTATIRVCTYPNDGYYRILKQFRYVVGNIESRENAVRKAREYINLTASETD